MTPSRHIHHEPGPLYKGALFVAQLVGLLFWLGSLSALVIVAGAAVGG